MALTIRKKEAIVDKIHKRINLALSVIIADFRGVSVNNITKLRKKALQSEVEINIVKNTLLKIAIKNTNFDSFSKNITGPTLIALSMKHPGSAAKLLQKFEKSNTNFKIKYGIFEKKILSNKEINKLALMPTYKESLIHIIVILKEITIGKLIRTLFSIKNKKLTKNK